MEDVHTDEPVWNRFSNDGSRRSLRQVPPAITPVTGPTLAAGARDHLQGVGRRRFREQIRGFLDGDSAATYTSFRRALADCLQTLGSEREGNTVLVPSFCSSDYPEAIEGLGFETARYDVDPETLSADLDCVRDHAFDDTLAVIAVNVLGYTSAMDELESLCSQRDTALIEALGYGIGTEYEGTRLGTFGDYSVLNFQQGKPIPIGGGMVVSQDPAVTFSDANRDPVGPNLGTLAGYALFSRPRLYGVFTRALKPVLSVLNGTDRPSTHPGSKFDVRYRRPYDTISNFQGAVGHRVFDQLPEHRRQRAQNAVFYRQELTEFPGVTPIEPVSGVSNHQHVRFPVRLDSTDRRNTLAKALGDAGIQASAMYDWPPIDPAVSGGGAKLQQQLLTLPTHPYVTDSDRRRVVRIFRENTS